MAIASWWAFDTAKRVAVTVVVTVTIRARFP
jgi:hypothetical protein